MRQYLQPVSNATLGECFRLHESNATPDQQFSYNPRLRQCYVVVPKLPIDFSCPSEDGNVLLFQSLVDDGDSEYGPPDKLLMTGGYKI